MSDLAKRFGEEFAYTTNNNGNPAIDRRILKAFRKAHRRHSGLVPVGLL